jgi:hypothetical protein
MLNKRTFLFAAVLSIIFAVTAWAQQPGGQGAPGGPGGPGGGGAPAGAMPQGGPGGGPGGAPGASPGGGPGGASTAKYHPAIYIEDGVYAKDKSVSSALSGGKVGNDSASGVKIVSKEDKANGVYVKGEKSVFTLSDSSIDLQGNGVNHADNYGVGAGAVVNGGATLILKNVKITTAGLGASAAASTGGSTLKVYDSTLITHGGVLPPGSPAPGSGPTAWGPPAALKIGGNARATNVTNSSKSYYYNSTIIADAWGALSTDEAGANGVYLEANNCNIQTLSNGYGTYADGGVKVVINKSKMITATYMGIAAGNGDITLNDVDGTSKYGVMMHVVGGGADTAGNLHIKGGKYNTEAAVVYIKSASPDVVIDGAELNPKDGVLIESVINDDGDAAKVAAGQKARAMNITLKNMNLVGALKHGDPSRDMEVALEAVTLKGPVQLATLSFGQGAKWTATADSKVTLKGAVSIDKIDAHAGVTIAATAGKDCPLKGTYKLASGGVLNVN